MRSHAFPPKWCLTPVPTQPLTNHHASQHNAGNNPKINNAVSRVERVLSGQRAMRSLRDSCVRVARSARATR